MASGAGRKPRGCGEWEWAHHLVMLVRLGPGTSMWQRQSAIDLTPWEQPQLSMGEGQWSWGSEGLRESGRPGGGTARTDQACEGYLGREEGTGVAAGEEWGLRKLVWFFVGFT